MTTRPIWAVAALVMRPDDGRILAINRPGAPDDLAMLGGHVDEGETPEEAVVRECREEASIEVDPACLEWLYDREDVSVGLVVRCFFVGRWTGAPESREPGLVVRWARAGELTTPASTFRRWVAMALFAAGFPFRLEDG